MVSFENTVSAFAARSDKELKQAYWLFNLVKKAWLVRLGKWMIEIAIWARLPVLGFVRNTAFRHFCGGETIEECKKSADHLNSFNISAILDYSVEGNKSEDDFLVTTNEVIASIDANLEKPERSFGVFKPTGIMQATLLEKVSSGKKLSEKEHVAFNKGFQRIERICQHAHDRNVRVLIDAEESWYQQAIDDIVEQLMERYNQKRAIVFNTIQLYRNDRLSFLKYAHEKATNKGYLLGVKLVRGAYMNKERTRALQLGYSSPIHLNKKAVDNDYDLALNYCLENIDGIQLCAGTHNEKSCYNLVALMEKHGLENHDNRIFFAQLYGMSDHISFNLAQNGYNVGKYLPYGPIKKVIPYLIRRAEENSAVTGQTGRELQLIAKEIKRRKTAKGN